MTFVAGYTNGYIYYTPSARQMENAGGAQEDSDCLLAPACRHAGSYVWADDYRGHGAVEVQVQVEAPPKR